MTAGTLNSIPLNPILGIDREYKMSLRFRVEGSTGFAAGWGYAAGPCFNQASNLNWACLRWMALCMRGLLGLLVACGRVCRF